MSKTLVDDLRASLTPGIGVSGGTFKLDVTSPTDVENLVISVVEVDTGREEEPAGPDSLVLRWFGKVVKSTFTLVPRKKGDNPEKNPSPGPSPPKIKIVLGGTTFDAELPGKESENGIFELKITMSSPGHKDWKSDTTVYVRDFQFYVAQGKPRPVVTFVTDRDDPRSTNQFMTAAARFWKHHADAVFVRPGIGFEGVMTFLRDRQAKFGNWGEVNIVNHGSIIPMLLRLFDGESEKFIDGHKIKEAFDPASKKDVSKLSPAGLDADSRVVHRACEAGNNQVLLDAINQKILKSACPVFIPKFLQGYISDGSGEFLAEMFTFFPPSRTSPAAAAIEAAMKPQFAKRYPGADFDVEKKTYEQRDNLQELNHFVLLREEKLFNGMGTSSPTAKTDADLKPELVSDWTAKQLDKDDRFWFTQPTDWDVSINKRTDRGVKADSYFFDVTVPAKGTATPQKVLFTTASTVSIGSGPTDTIQITAPGVVAGHATVVISSFNSTTPGALDLTITGASGAKVVVAFGGGAPVSIPPSINATATGFAKLTLGTASVTVRFPKQVELEFGLRRRFVQWRRKFRIFDPKNPLQKYEDRPVVVPDLTKPEHYGKGG